MAGEQGEGLFRWEQGEGSFRWESRLLYYILACFQEDKLRVGKVFARHCCVPVTVLYCKS